MNQQQPEGASVLAVDGILETTDSADLGASMEDRSEAELVFSMALSKTTSADRIAFLDETCGANSSLRKQVERLLAAHDEMGQFLENPIQESDAVGRFTGDCGKPSLPFFEPSSAPNSLGRLDHYEILEVVGQGGMGVVLRAKDTKLQRNVAIKVLASAMSVSPKARKWFKREAQTAAAVRDDHVVAIHAVVDDAPLPYLVMEYIEGRNLADLLREHGPMRIDEALRIGHQVARGLDAAHQKGLIHRDVKPANILLEFGTQRVKLTDFGLARAVDDASLSQNELVAGTPMYMAPEQASSSSVDHRADLFSLGSVLYEMCAGRPAFGASTSLASMKRVCEEDAESIDLLRPDIPPALRDLIQRLHAKHVDDRPSTAAEVANCIFEIQQALQQNNDGVVLNRFHGAGEQRADELSQPVRAISHRQAWGWGDLPIVTQGPWLRLALAVTVILTGFGLSEAGGLTQVHSTVIRFLSNGDGVLVVEADDPEVSVTVDGTDVVITGAGPREIRLKPGSYRVQARKDGRLVGQELINVTRDGRRVVRLSSEPTPHQLDAEVWAEHFRSLPVDEQGPALIARLKALNPNFDGNVAYVVRDGAIVKLRFVTDDVTDISPLSAVSKLEELDCNGNFFRKGKLSDLSPLRGLPLKRLNCNSTRVDSLEALRGMPLTTLIAGETRLADLSPLKGMKLESLTLQRTEVVDLSPLRGMPIRHLDLFWAQGIKDLRPLEGMPLVYLNLTALWVPDLNSLREMKTLNGLVLESVPVTDLSPLKGLSIKVLCIRGVRAADLSPLKTLPLEHLRLDYRADREEFVRSFPNLKIVNDKSITDFWANAGQQP